MVSYLLCDHKNKWLVLFLWVSIQNEGKIAHNQVWAWQKWVTVQSHPPSNDSIGVGTAIPQPWILFLAPPSAQTSVPSEAPSPSWRVWYVMSHVIYVAQALSGSNQWALWGMSCVWVLLQYFTVLDMKKAVTSTHRIESLLSGDTVRCSLRTWK